MRVLGDMLFEEQVDDIFIAAAHRADRILAGMSINLRASLMELYQYISLLAYLPLATVSASTEYQL